MPIISTMRAAKAASKVAKPPIKPLAPINRGIPQQIDFTKLEKLEKTPDIDFTQLKKIENNTQVVNTPEPYKLKKQDELDILDAEKMRNSGLMSKKEFEEEVEMIKNPIDIKSDTRGQGTQYHGTSSEIGVLDNDYYTTMNIYGQGLYTTDAVDIASGYSRKGKGKNPTMYKVEKKRELNLYDMEEPLTPEFRASIEDADINTEGLTTLREVYDELRYDEFTPADEVQEMFETISSQLQEKGYDGLRHIGGSFTNKKPHNVEIIFKPRDVLDIKKLRIRNDIE